MFEGYTMTDDTGHFVMDRVPSGNVSVGRSICINDRSYTTTHNVYLRTERGQIAHVTIGGTGQPVIGQLVVPAGFERNVDWTACDFSELRTKLPELPQPTLPNNWQAMTDDQKRAFGKQWQETWDNSDEGRAYDEASKAARNYPFAVRADGSFRVEDVLPGIYQLHITLGGEPHTNGAAIVRQPIASLVHEFTIPDLPGGHSDAPLDLGELPLEPSHSNEL